MSVGNSTPSEAFWVSPLYSFDCDTESIDLTRGIQIKQAPDELKDYIREKAHYLYGLWEDPSKFEWAVFLPHTSSNVEGLSLEQRMSVGITERERDADSFIDFLTTLRLFRSGKVCAGPLISGGVANSQLYFGGSTIWARVSDKNPIFVEPKYSFCKEHLTEFNTLLEDIFQSRETEVLNVVEVALRRFHSSYRGDMEDRIIDQMIAFESLFLGNPQELSYKLALRVAFLLEREESKRSSVYANMKKAYSYRSKIVHDNNPPSWKDLHEMVIKTEEYLRRSIIVFLRLLIQGESLKLIHKNLLDENIIKNGGLLTAEKLVEPD